ncbi:MAG: VanW family protein [Clostridia bacterium]|nr:VanW family protein [Clostridia bacterium]
MAKEIDVNKMRQARAQKKKNKKFTVLIAGICILVFFLAAAFAAPLTYDKIYKNVSVAGIKTGGMTYDEALSALTEKFGEFVPQIKLSALDTTTNLDFNIICEYNLEETAKNAFNYGKGNIFTKFFFYYFGKADLPLVISANTEALTNELINFQNSLPNGFVDTSYKIEDDALIVTAGKSGNALDIEAISKEIIKAVEKGTDVSIDAKTTIKNYEGVDVDKLYEQVYCEPQDAYLDEESSKIIPHKVGYSFDKEKAKTILANASNGEEYKIQLSLTYPEVTEDTLTGEMFGDTLASYSTKYNPGEVNRTHNMYLASSKVNGTVINPGEVFSYNGVVGERTVAKGYRNAKVFENGQVVDGLAGGICQVSTTIYNAALYANLEIVERKNHSFPVSYAPMGQDATVAMGSIDFRFRNNTKYPIKVVSSVSGGICTVTILGTDKDHYKVEIQNSITATRPRPVEYENDPTLEKGVEKVKQSGSDGYTISSRRIVSKNGEIVKNEAIHSSYYIPLKKIILRNEEEDAPAEEPQTPEGEAPPAEGEAPGEAVEPTEPVTNPDTPAVTEPVQPSDIPNEPNTTPSAPIPGITPEADPNTGV